MSSPPRAAFFILPPLVRVRRTRADDADEFLLIFRVYHDEQMLAMRKAHGHPTILVVRMVWICNRD
jgi:hypothetical protein